MKGYKHLSEGERRQIYRLKLEGREQKYIAEKLSRSPGSISREIKRGSNNGEYQPAYAQREYERRRSEINKGRSKLKNNEKWIQEIEGYMEKDRRSPDSIAGHKKKIEKVEFVCTATIYNYIKTWRSSWKERLKYKKGYKKKGKKDGRGKQKENFKSIEERPKKVETRERIGDFELDTIHSSGSERKGGVVTIVCRKSRFLLGEIVKTRKAKDVGDALIRQLENLPKEKLHTMTTDNGKEFYDFERVESALKTPIYFAHPYASCERGTNEQTNGMIRVFFPKGTNFRKVSEEELQRVIKLINRKPRRSLGYRSAYDVFHGIS